MPLSYPFPPFEPVETHSKRTIKKTFFQLIMWDLHLLEVEIEIQ